MGNFIEVWNFGEVNFEDGSAYLAHIGPDFAKAMLKRNFARNRKINKYRVSEMARDMESGRWSGLTSDPIKMSRSGAMLNGQHRLAAVLKSGATIEQIIITGLDDGDFRYMDLGQARSTHQLLSYKPTKNEAAVGRAVFSLHKGASLRSVLNSAAFIRQSASVQEFIDWMDENHEAVAPYALAGARIRAKVECGSTACYAVALWAMDSIYGAGFAERFEEYFKGDSPGATKLHTTIMKQFLGDKKLAKSAQCGILLQAAASFSASGALSPKAVYNKYDAALEDAEEKLGGAM